MTCETWTKSSFLHAVLVTLTEQELNLNHYWQSVDMEIFCRSESLIRGGGIKKKIRVRLFSSGSLKCLHQVSRHNWRQICQVGSVKCVRDRNSANTCLHLRCVRTALPGEAEKATGGSCWEMCEREQEGQRRGLAGCGRVKGCLVVVWWFEQNQNSTTGFVFISTGSRASWSIFTSRTTVTTLRTA